MWSLTHNLPVSVKFKHFVSIPTSLIAVQQNLLYPLMLLDVKVMLLVDVVLSSPLE